MVDMAIFGLRASGNHCYERAHLDHALLAEGDVRQTRCSSWSDTAHTSAIGNVSRSSQLRSDLGSNDLEAEVDLRLGRSRHPLPETTRN